ncbi:MAG: hypothetical protein KAT15_24045, partial [Bacteroidales bacterium]|nr:hypothetical protein [Bacteroidales bacterium]
KELEAFQQEVGKANSQLESAEKKILSMKKACFILDRNAPELLEQVYKVESVIRQLDLQLNGNQSKNEMGEKQVPTPGLRMMVGSRGLSTSYGPTELHRESLELGKKELEPITSELKKVTNELLPGLEKALKDAGAPWIEGQ